MSHTAGPGASRPRQLLALSVVFLRSRLDNSFVHIKLSMPLLKAFINSVMKSSSFTGSYNVNARCSVRITGVKTAISGESAIVVAGSQSILRIAI